MHSNERSTKFEVQVQNTHDIRVVWCRYLKTYFKVRERIESNQRWRMLMAFE